MLRNSACNEKSDDDFEKKMITLRHSTEEDFSSTNMDESLNRVFTNILPEALSVNKS